MSLNIYWPPISWLSIILAALCCALGKFGFDPIYRRAGRSVETDAAKSASNWKIKAFLYLLYFAGYVLCAATVPQVLGSDPALGKAIKTGLVVAGGIAFVTYAYLTLTTELTFPQVATVAAYIATAVAVMFVGVGLFG